MSNNLPQKYNSNIFHKFWGYIRNLFFNKSNKSSESKTISDFASEKVIQKSNDFAENMKVETNLKNAEYEKQKFMENLKKNPDLLENFTNNRLERILQYYLDENEKKRELLKKLTT